MDTKKDIGKFFKDHLNQMDFAPNEKVWTKINEELVQKKKRRRKFFALFFLAFSTGSIFTLLLVNSTNWINFKDYDKKNSNKLENNSNSESSSSNFFDTKTSKSNTKNTLNNNIINNTNEYKPLNKNQNNYNSNNNKLKNNSNLKNIDHDDRDINKISKKIFNKDTLKVKSWSNSKFITEKNQKQSNKNNKTKGVITLGVNTLTDLNDFSSSNTVEINISKTDSKIDTVKTSITLLEIRDSLSIVEISNKQNKKLEPEKEKDSTEVKPKVKTNPFIISSYYGTGLFPKNQVKGNFNSNNLVASKNEQYGVIFRWMANQYYGLQIGIGYINTSTQTEIEKTNSNTLLFNDVNNNSGVTFPSTNKLMMHHNLSMYEIPLEIYYKLSDKKIGFALSSGISHTIIKDNSVSIDTADGTIKIGSLESLNKSNFTANLKFYSHYKFSDKLQFEVYPSFQYQLLNTIKSKDLNSTIFSIRAGIAYKF